LSEHYQRRTLNYAHNLDTALVLVNQAADLSRQLRYERGQQEALFQQGKVYIKQEKLSKVKKMLSSLSGVTHIRLLLELGKNKLRPTTLRKPIWTVPCGILTRPKGSACA
jgi:hypothetical protein